ncbi:AAA domain-containing protein [Streptosporangium sp. NPDC023825]|uniref:DEAD/DEAH box helicase n=1 Tax=Streptosporangium sp. NPDC023825 TaxID=3154909 RepID=UPI003445C231
MKRAQTAPLPGAEALVWLDWQSGDRPRPGDEIRLWWAPDRRTFARTHAAEAPVAPTQREDGEKLESVRRGGAHYVAIVVESRELTRGRSRTARLGVTFYRYDAGGTLPAQEIAVDHDIARTVARWEGSQAYATQTDRTIGWLRECFLLPAVPRAPAGTPGRVIISTAVGEHGAPTGYRLHGRGFVADIRTRDGRLRMQRIRRTANADLGRRLRLVTTGVDFADVSHVAQMRADMERWIERLTEGKGLLALWNQYNRLEARHLLRRVEETGYVTYRSWSRLAREVYRFEVVATDDPTGHRRSLLEQARQALKDGDTLELEASKRLPPVLANPGTGPGTDEEAAEADDWEVVQQRLEKHLFSGTVVAVDVADGTIDIRRTELQRRGPAGVGGDETVQPEHEGFLFRSFRGDRRQLARRRTAYERILRGGTNIPNLLALLEGEQVVANPSERIEPRSEATWAIFGGTPTERQQQAIDVALNTPDIAIIQGPPGTGKTEVISAIQTRLAESGRSYAHVRGSILLTSFQHAAVEEMAERSMVFGIPANKIDRADRGAAVLRDRLRDTAAAHLPERLGEPGEAVLTLRRLSGLVAGYWLTPPAPDGTVELLEEVHERTRAHITVALAERLRAARDELRITLAAAPPGGWNGPVDETHELALMAVRALRTTPEAFADDGPQAAAKALRRLRAITTADGDADGGPPAADLTLLERVADSDPDHPPVPQEDLVALRDRLIDRLLPQAGPEPVRAADPAVNDLLNQAVAEMEESLRRTPDMGATLALADYYEALQGDPLAVEWTLRAYTASYATTCQQAASQKVVEAKQVDTDEDVVFDTVVIDEAARANPLDLMIPMALAARRIVLVGDHLQLPPLLEPDVERALVRQDGSTQEVLRQSLFERLFRAHDNKGSPVRRVVTLNAQFRMHSVLGDFVSRNFYRNTLGSPRGTEGFAHGLPEYGEAVAVWADVPADRGGEFRTRSTHRPAERDWLVKRIPALLEAAPDLRIGVMSFYTRQVQEIGDALQRLGVAARDDKGHYEAAGRYRHDSRGRPLNRLHIGSVDSFQGKQFDIVLLSATRSAPPGDDTPPADPAMHRRWVGRRYGHLTLTNRLCVAMSRQRRLLVVVGDAAMFEKPRAPDGVAPLTDFLLLCREGGDHGRFVS